MQLAVVLTMPGIKAIVPCHLEVFFRDVLDKQLNKINGRKSFSDERIVFMPVVMKGYVITIVRINSGKSDNRPAEIAADIFDNRLRVAEIRLCINIKAIFVLMVYFRFCLFKRRADALFKFIQQDSLKRFTEVRIIEVFNSAPETVIRISAFGKKAVDVWVPFKRTSKGMKDADKARDKIFGFAQGEKEFLNDIGNSLEEAVKQAAVFKEKMTKGIVNCENEVPVGTMD